MHSGKGNKICLLYVEQVFGPNTNDPLKMHHFYILKLKKPFSLNKHEEFQSIQYMYITDIYT